VVVYDVGGSHVSAAVCSVPEYRLGNVVEAPLPSEGTSEAFIEELARLAVDAGGSATGIAGTAMAMPGPFDYENGVSWMRHKMPYLYGVNIRQALASRMAWEEGRIRFLNDAAGFLWGEIGAGAARSVQRATGITLGTGVGSAFAAGGRVVTQGPGVPKGGEIWSIPFAGGIVEDLISTRAIKGRYRELTGTDREVAQIAAAAPGDPVAVQVFAEFGRNLGTVLRELMGEFDPEVVVFGGGIARSATLFLPAVLSALQGLRMQPRISSLGERAPLLGAGVSWFAQEQERS
jgi:glucokinase